MTSAVRTVMPRLAPLAFLPLTLLTACGSDEPEPVEKARTSAESARVCDGASENARCVDVTDRAVVADLERAFTTGKTADEDCPGVDQVVYRIVFSDPGGERTVDVPGACGPTFSKPAYEVTDDERELLVRTLAQKGPRAAGLATEG